MTRAPAYAPAVVVAVVALVARLAPVLRGGGLTGLQGYDDGVYYSAADALVSGRVPYRDFLLLHPPGIMVALAPFAALGRLAGDPVGLAAGRLAFMAVGTISAVLVWWLARRVSPVAGVAAGLGYAVWRVASDSEGSTLLEPLVNLGLLASLALLGDGRPSRRRLAAAGAALGLAVTVKAWAVVPFVVLAAWVWRRAGPRRALAYAGSGAGAATLLALPFYVAAGPAMLRMVVVDQLGRPDNGIPTISRLADVLSLQVSPGPVGQPLAVVTLVAAAGVAVAAALLTWHRPRTRLWAALLLAAVAMLLSSPSFFGHYGDFAAPPLALLAGAAVDSVATSTRWRTRALRPAVAVAGLAAVALLSAHVVTAPEGHHARLTGAAARGLAGARCVAADSAVALVVSGVLSRDLARGCPVLVDVTGLTYDQDRGDLVAGPTPSARRRDREWQRTVDRYLTGADAVLLERWHADGLDPWVLSGLEHRDRELGRPSYRVLVPAA